MNELALFFESTIRTCIVYDTKSGEIIHVHEFLALPGVTPPTDTELEAQACVLACRITGKESSEIAPLHVRREDLKIDVQYVVNPKKKIIVAKD